MKLIYFPLGVMIIICAINLFLGGTFQDVSYDRFDQTFHYHLDLTTIALTILTGAIITIALLGFQILGSGLDESAHHMIILIIFYVGIWGLLTTLAWSMIWSIDFVGLIIYFLLFISFVIGVIQELGSGS